jgi:hypothetical protein
MRVLVVEDELKVANALKEGLEGERSASNGPQLDTIDSYALVDAAVSWRRVHCA